MNKSLSYVITVLSTVSMILTLSCGKLDVVGKDSARAFGELLQKAPGLVSEDTLGGGWSITAPDSGARFVWGAFGKMMIDIAPFAAAGLDTLKLADAGAFSGGTLVIGTALTLDAPPKTTPLASYEWIVKNNRDAIGYHAALNHYGISLGNGNMFEWAKDLNTNDKDIVFVLNPEPFINAGVDVTKIEGWAFAKVTVDDENGKPVQVDKILKPFDLK
ncbi:MAG: hypothetical protein LBB74_07425 [Chitinispirillales bacterium]|jgi:hypothetical protein|nr:hypothetical protein [Chitinispirillales bacterium]